MTLELKSLDTIVLETINKYLQTGNLPSIDLSGFDTPLVVGSGNGDKTGRILFRNTAAFFATESEVSEKLANIPSITDVVVVSASGEKHAPIILQAAKDAGKKTFLISSSEISTGKTLADTSYIFPKIAEPYTYNTSTYFGYLYGAEKNFSLEALRDFLTGEFEKILNSVHWTDYTGFCIVLPNQFVLYREMIETKFIELFGRKVARDVFTYEQMRHATTVIQDEKELFICFGNSTRIQYGENQVNLPIFTETNYAAMMLTGYYLVGKIQTAFPPYFFDSLEEYCERSRVLSGFNISPIVPA